MPFAFILMVFAFGVFIGIVVCDIMHRAETNKRKKANKKLRRKVRTLKAALAGQNPPGAE
jgi:hypothetical protein